MAKDVRDIVFRFVGESRDLQRATDQAERGLGGIRDGMKKVAGLAAGAFAVSSIVDFGRAAIDAASDYTESVNAVEVATGEASEGILALGDTAAEQFGLSKTNLNEAAVALDGFLEQLDQPQDQAFEDIIGRATDFASVMNLDVNDALGKFRSGLAGESEPLRAFGLDLSAAAVSAHAVSEGLHATGKNMTEAEKVAARYSLIMQETAAFQGDFANTSDSAANQTKILEARVADLTAELGQKMIPVYQRALSVATTAVGGLSDALEDTASEQELLNRRMFEAAKEAGKVDGTYSDLSESALQVAGDTSIMSRVWDVLIGRTRELDTELETLGGNIEESVPEWYNLFSGTLSQGFKDAEDAARDMADALPEESEAERVERFTARTTAALGDVATAWRNARRAAEEYQSLDFVAFGVGDDRPSERGAEDQGYTQRNGTPPTRD